MTKLYAVLVGSLLLAGGSSAMARPDADDTLTQIHRLPNEIIGAAELRPVFRFGRRLQVGVSTGVQDDVLLAGKNKDDTVSTGVQDDVLVAPPKKDDIVSTGVQVDGIHADAGNNKDDTVSTAKAEEARAKAKAYAELEADYKHHLAEVREWRAKEEAKFKAAVAEAEEERDKAEARFKAAVAEAEKKRDKAEEEARSVVEFWENKLKAEEARMKAGR